MALSPIEDRYLSNLTAAQFPDMPVAETQQPVADATQFDGMQLAAAPTKVVSDAGGGRGSYAGFDPRMDAANKGRRDEMRAYDPTTRERIASFLQAGFEGLGMDRYKARQNAQTLIGGPSSNLPLDIGIADLLAGVSRVGLAATTPLYVEEGSRAIGRGMEAAKRGEYGTAALETGAGLLDVVPGVVGGVNVGRKLVEATKNLPVGMSTQAVGGMQNVLTPTAKATAPVNDMGFYSAVEQAALNIQRKSGTGQAMLNDITKGQDVKLDEVKWMGLDDFLKGKKNVTREEVQQFIAQNKVDVQEVTLGDVPFGSAERQELAALSDIPRSQRTAEQSARINQLQDMANSEDAGASMTKFGQYTLPGGENYREILLTLPTADSADDARRLALMSIDRERPLTDVESAELRDLLAKKRSRTEQTTFTSSHWDEKNVLAHIRVNDRVDADGKKMLLIEEVQSDWHQAGRDKGYKSDPKPTVKAFEVSVDGRPVMAYETMEEAQAHVQRASQYNDPNSITVSEKMVEVNDPVSQANRVPDAPMKDTWYQLALKRVLKYAADNGYERVGLTTGARQAERYDLSKQISKVYYSPPDSKQANKFGTVLKAFDKRGNEVINKSVTPDQLPDYIGKEVAKKLLESEGNSMGVKALDGVDLQVGGEGMKKYYDEVYPQFLAKYGKKWGAKVGETKLKTTDIDPARWTIVRDADNNFRIQDSLSDRFAEPGVYSTREDAVDAIGKMNYREPVRFVDITPEMRQGVGKGQPLFSATAASAGTGAATMQDKEQK